MMRMSELTWRCDVCGEERPDEYISVFKKDIPCAGLPPGTMTRNIKYCNDRESCEQGAARRGGPDSPREEEKFKAMDSFRIEHDDLPDGAFFAIAEECGFSADDWLWFSERDAEAKKAQNVQCSGRKK